MRVLFTSIEGAGHLNPLLPYAVEMSRRGHDVRIAISARQAGKVEAAGLGHVATEYPSAEERAAFFAKYRDVPPSQFGKVGGGALFGDFLPRKALPSMRAAVESWRPHLIVREAGEVAGAIVSDLTGTPHVRVSISNGHAMTETVAPVDAIRAELGLAPDGGASMRAARAFSSFPASMEPEDADGGDLPQFRVAPPPPPPASEAPDWIAPGDGPLLYMTFGTVMGGSDEAKATFRAALAAVAAAGLRTLMTTGPVMDVDALGPVPPNVTLRAFVPQDAVFPHVSAMLCHGGSGTVLGALAAGLPLVVTPIGADQPENAAAVARVGAGLSVPTRDADEIGDALHRVLSEPRYVEGARQVAAEMAASPSLPDAVDEMLRHARPAKTIA